MPNTLTADFVDYSIRLPKEFLQVARVLARDETRSVNGQLVQLVKEALERRQALRRPGYIDPEEPPF
jgi:hypothetical protein